MYCSIEDVKMITGVKPQFFRLDKYDEVGLNIEIEKLILQSEGLIRSYIWGKEEEDHNDFFPVPKTIENVCLRLTANMIAFMQARHDTPIQKVNDWSIQIISSEIFTDDLKEDLAPYIVERKSAYSDRIDFFAITGDDDDCLWW